MRKTLRCSVLELCACTELWALRCMWDRQPSKGVIGWESVGNTVALSLTSRIKWHFNRGARLSVTIRKLSWQHQLIKARWSEKMDLWITGDSVVGNVHLSDNESETRMKLLLFFYLVPLLLEIKLYTHIYINTLNYIFVSVRGCQ